MTWQQWLSLRDGDQVLLRNGRIIHFLFHYPQPYAAQCYRYNVGSSKTNWCYGDLGKKIVAVFRQRT